MGNQISSWGQHKTIIYVGLPKLEVWKHIVQSLCFVTNASATFSIAAKYCTPAVPQHCPVWKLKSEYSGGFFVLLQEDNYVIILLYSIIMLRRINFIIL